MLLQPEAVIEGSKPQYIETDSKPAKKTGSLRRSLKGVRKQNIRKVTKL